MIVVIHTATNNNLIMSINHNSIRGASALKIYQDLLVQAYRDQVQSFYISASTIVEKRNASTVQDRIPFEQFNEEILQIYNDFKDWASSNSVTSIVHPPPTYCIKSLNSYDAAAPSAVLILIMNNPVNLSSVNEDTILIENLDTFLATTTPFKGSSPTPSFKGSSPEVLQSSVHIPAPSSIAGSNSTIYDLTSFHGTCAEESIPPEVLYNFHSQCENKYLTSAEPGSESVMESFVIMAPSNTCIHTISVQN